MAQADVEEDGTVFIASVDAEGGLQARRGGGPGCRDQGRIDLRCEGRSTRTSAASWRSPGRTPLCHISELDTGYVENVEKVVKVGDVIKVKVVNVDEMVGQVSARPSRTGGRQGRLIRAGTGV